MQITVTIEGVRRVVNVTDETNRAVVRELKKILHDSARNAVRMAKEDAPPPFTGNLRRSIKFVVIGRLLMAVVRAKARHAWLVAHGRTPGKQPPIDAIMAWVLSHRRDFGLHTFKQVTRHKAGAAKVSAIASEAQLRARLAFLVARAIARKGTRGHPFMDRAIATVKPQFEAQAREALERAVRAGEKAR